MAKRSPYTVFYHGYDQVKRSQHYRNNKAENQLDLKQLKSRVKSLEPIVSFNSASLRTLSGKSIIKEGGQLVQYNKYIYPTDRYLGHIPEIVDLWDSKISNEELIEKVAQFHSNGWKSGLIVRGSDAKLVAIKDGAEEDWNR